MSMNQALVSYKRLSTLRLLLATCVFWAASAGDARAQAEQAPPPFGDARAQAEQAPPPFGDARAQAEQAPPPAEPVPQPPAETAREGFLLGASLGFGSLDTGNSSESTLNYHIELRGFLQHNWAIAVGFWGGQHNEDFTTITNNNGGLMTQYWFSDAFWLKGVVGKASLSVEFDGVSAGDFNGMAIGGIFGWDFYDSGNYHMHASVGLTLEGYEDINDNATATAFQLGLQYY